MARARTKPASTTARPSPPTDTITDPLTVRWTLAELPSPQHRAGLAGLAMLVAFTKRHALKDGAVLDQVFDDIGLELTLNLSGLEALFDRVYDADREEASVAKPWTKKTKGGGKVEVPPKRRETRTETDKKGQTKEVEVCIYDIVVPRGGPLGELAPLGDNGRWTKLWRDWLWQTLRAIPKQRLPYNLRAGDGVATEEDEVAEDGPKDASVAWSALHGDPSLKQASTYFLGAMDVNAEVVPFLDRGRFLFLLHFWPFAIHVFLPQQINAKGERSFDGFAVCIPDVSRLREFTIRHERSLRQRAPEVAGFRPRQAIIDLADAAALETERWLDQAVGDNLAQAAPATAGWQIIHAAKDGNSVRIRTNRMICPTRSSLDRSAVMSECRSHLIKHQVLANILAEHAWWRGFDRVCAVHSKDLTIKDAGFRHDAQLLFTRFHSQPVSPDKDAPMSEQNADQPRKPRDLEPLILHVVQSWLTGRLKSKYDLAYREVKDGDRSEFDQKKSKLATEAFLAARSRPGREFARWFTSTLCSENQRLNEDEFVLLAKALDERPDQIRSLTLLALSARG